MTTIKDIQEGNYCQNCDIDCKYWSFGSDCCVVETAIGRLYFQLHYECLDTEMKYEKTVVE